MDFLSLFFYRLPQDYIPKKRKKKVPSCIFSQESWCSSTHHVCKYNCMYSILHSYIHSTSKTSIYSVIRRLTDFSVLDEAYFLPNSFYVDFPIEINVPHTQTIQLAVIYLYDGLAKIFLIQMILQVKIKNNGRQSSINYFNNGYHENILVFFS